MATKVMDDITELLDDARAYFEDRMDVVDGDYGVPSPNKEMRFAQRCQEVLDAIEAERTLATLARRAEEQADAERQEAYANDQADLASLYRRLGE